MKRSFNSRSKHGGKSRTDLENYTRFIQGTKASRLGDTSIESDVKSSDEASDASLEKKAGTSGLSPAKIKPMKRPRSSINTVLKKHGIKILASVLGAILLVIFTIALGSLWSLNREVGVMGNDIGELKNKYESISPSVGSSTEYIVFKVQVEKDLQYIQDRLQRLEIKVFHKNFTPLLC